MREACGEAALHRAMRDAFAYRCGGSTGWLDCGAGRLPVSRLTARTGAARASTKTRASVGGGARSVKAARGVAGCRAPVRASRPRHARRRRRCGRGRFAAGDRCAIVCAAFGARMRNCAHAVKRETGSGRPPSLCCPRNGTPPARRAFARAPMPPTMPLPLNRREGCGLASGQPGYRPTQGASAVLAERPIRGGRIACAFCPRSRGHVRSVMCCLSAGRRCAARLLRCSRFPVSTRRAPCCAR